MGGYSHERKHLVFHKRPRTPGRKTDQWVVMNGEHQYLAWVTYRAGWRRYVLRFPPYGSTIDFDAKCLKEAVAFVDEQTAKLKATWKKRKEKP